MAPNKNKRFARKHADTRDGYCFDAPIVIDDHDELSSTRTTKKRSIASTSPWQAEMAKMRGEGVNPLAQADKPASSPGKRRHAHLSDEDDEVEENNTRPSKQPKHAPAQHKPSFGASAIESMQQDYDRQRRASAELLRAKESEQLGEKRKQERDAAAEKARELSALEREVQSMWQIYDADDQRDRRMRMGQYSKAGKRRVEERQKARAREAARRG
ncbi:hypothetical protein diail_1315 [Diaporthe ilicicola]|nr:hypothetical protein diail_1315 [Diaporthe ilicicola]